MQIVETCKTTVLTADMFGADRRTWLSVNGSFTVQDFLRGVCPLDKVSCNLILTL